MLLLLTGTSYFSGVRLRFADGGVLPTFEEAIAGPNVKSLKHMYLLN
jgi:hypothetical protein